MPTPMEFTVEQLLLAGEWQPEMDNNRGKIYTKDVSEKMKDDIFRYLVERNGCTASQCAINFKRGVNTIKHYLQELSREDRVVMRMNLHNKPATYVAKR